MLAHALRAFIEALEPGIVGVHAFQRELETEPRSQSPCQCCLSGSNHPGHGENEHWRLLVFMQ
jgi:hypothetical protein